MTETGKELEVKPWEWVEGEHGYSALCDADNNEIITTGGYNDGDYPIVWMGEEMTDEHKELISQAPVTKAKHDALLSANAGMREALEKIMRGPAHPAPDPYAHSWEAFARHWNGFAVDARMAAKDALSALPAGEAGDLHPDTCVALAAFMAALRAKLRRAEEKYGYTNGWKTEDWEAQCKAHLLEHLHKGDPLDVAAYAMFCHQRGWSTSSTGEAVTVGGKPTERQRALWDAEHAIEDIENGYNALRQSADERGDTRDAVTHSYCRNTALECRRAVQKLMGEAPTPSPSERVEKLDAALAQAVKMATDGLGASKTNGAVAWRDALYDIRALLSVTEGE